MPKHWSSSSARNKRRCPVVFVIELSRWSSLISVAIMMLLVFLSIVRSEAAKRSYENISRMLRCYTRGLYVEFYDLDDLKGINKL
jgi:hypothetical protein